MSYDTKPYHSELWNFIVDEFWPLLQPGEKDVLIFFIRRIVGFHKEETGDRISRSQIAKGCGITSEKAATSAKSLEEFGFVIVASPAIPEQQKGPHYLLQMKPELIHKRALEERKEEEKKKNARKTQKGRVAAQSETANLSRALKVKRKEEKEAPPVCSTDRVEDTPQSVEQTTPGLLNRPTKQKETKRAIKKEFGISTTSYGTNLTQPDNFPDYDFSEAEALFAEIDEAFAGYDQK